MIAGAMATSNKKRIVCFVEVWQLNEIELKAKEEGVSRSSIIRRKLENGN